MSLDIPIEHSDHFELKALKNQEMDRKTLTSWFSFCQRSYCSKEDCHLWSRKRRALATLIKMGTVLNLHGKAQKQPMCSLLVSLCWLDTHSSHLGWTKLTWGIASIISACTQNCGCIFFIVNWYRRSHSTTDQSTLKWVGLGCIRKVAEQGQG